MNTRSVNQSELKAVLHEWPILYVPLTSGLLVITLWFGKHLFTQGGGFLLALKRFVKVARVKV